MCGESWNRFIKSVHKNLIPARLNDVAKMHKLPFMDRMRCGAWLEDDCWPAQALVPHLSLSFSQVLKLPLTLLCPHSD